MPTGSHANQKPRLKHGVQRGERVIGDVRGPETD